MNEDKVHLGWKRNEQTEAQRNQRDFKQTHPKQDRLYFVLKLAHLPEESPALFQCPGTSVLCTLSLHSAEALSRSPSPLSLIFLSQTNREAFRFLRQ